MGRATIDTAPQVQISTATYATVSAHLGCFACESSGNPRNNDWADSVAFLYLQQLHCMGREGGARLEQCRAAQSTISDPILDGRQKQLGITRYVMDS